MTDEVLERHGRPAASVVAATILNHVEATSCQLMSQEAPVIVWGPPRPAFLRCAPPHLDR